MYTGGENISTFKLDFDIFWWVVVNEFRHKASISWSSKVPPTSKLAFTLSKRLVSKSTASRRTHCDGFWALKCTGQFHVRTMTQSNSGNTDRSTSAVEEEATKVKRITQN